MKKNLNIQPNSSHNTVINDELNINSTFDTLNKTADANELRTNHELNVRYLIDIPYNTEIPFDIEMQLNDVSNIYRSSVNSEILVKETIMESANDASEIIEDLSNTSVPVTKPMENKVMLLTQQLKEIRNRLHLRFMNENDLINDDARENNDDRQWPKGIICVIGDSIIQGLDERRLCKSGTTVKVRCFPGANISDMYHFCIPIINKRPSFLILHVSTNDAEKYMSREILDKLLSHKLFLQSKLPTCKIIISTPTTFRSDNGKCCLTIVDI